MRCRPLSRITRALAILLIWSPVAFPADSLPLIRPNQNRSPAGVLYDGILTIQLEIAKGDWHPEAEDGMALSVYAFGEAGKPLQNPGPLIRVPQGTEIHGSLHNSLSVPVAVHGFGDPAAGDASVHVAPGAIELVRFKAKNPGLYLYWGATDVDDLKLRYGIDSELTGAIVVDPPGADTNEEILVMEMISEHAGLASRKTLATINGKSWPYTQRFQYQLGQRVRWRWINATNEPHALHLHGFYFRIDAFNRGGRIESYAGESRPLAVTQRIAQGETFDMSWAPDRPGRWLFHCHMLIHMTPPIIPDLPGLAVQPASSASSPHAAMGDAMGMGQLVLGITVPEDAMASPIIPWHADRRFQLEISERGGAPRYALQLHENGQADTAIKPGLIGPPIVLTRGQPVEIEVLNKLQQPTAIHWHGIELESYYDGVPGWTGRAAQTTPIIVPGTSFVARMTPPRAGTFIYHTHWHDELQLRNGIYGPLIVLPPGEKLDPASDLTFVFSLGDFGVLQELALINGSPQSKMLRLQAGKKYRFRLINISTNNQAMQVSLGDPNGPVDWRVIAKDGADLPPTQTHSSKAQLTITVGETYDVEFSTSRPRELLLDLLLPGQKIHTSQTLLFLPDQGSTTK
jgi:manganese oxidase